MVRPRRKCSAARRRAALWFSIPLWLLERIVRAEREVAATAPPPLCFNLRTNPIQPWTEYAEAL